MSAHETDNPNTVDIVITTIHEGDLKVLLHRRPNAPFAGEFALPGGYIHKDKDASLEAAAMRILKTKVGMEPLHFEQLGAYGGPDRDPRGWSISTAYLATLPYEQIAPVLDADKGLQLFSMRDLRKVTNLPFDHGKIIGDAEKRIRAKASYSLVAAAFIGEEFTLPELKTACDILMDMEMSDVSFRRRIASTGLLKEVGKRTVGASRPAKVYRLNMAPGVGLDMSFRQSW